MQHPFKNLGVKEPKLGAAAGVALGGCHHFTKLRELLQHGLHAALEVPRA